MVDRALIRLLLVLLAIVFAVLWLFSAIAGLDVPNWIPPSGLLALAIASLL